MDNQLVLEQFYRYHHVTSQLRLRPNSLRDPPRTLCRNPHECASGFQIYQERNAMVVRMRRPYLPRPCYGSRIRYSTISSALSPSH